MPKPTTNGAQLRGPTEVCKGWFLLKNASAASVAGVLVTGL